MHRRSPFHSTLFANLKRLRCQFETKARELSAAIKAQVATADSDRPSELVRTLAKQLRKAKADWLRQIRIIQRTVGISERQIRALEKLQGAKALPNFDLRFWRDQVEDFPGSKSSDLDAMAQAGFERLLSLVDPRWLQMQERLIHRLGPEFLQSPLRLANGFRLGPANNDHRHCQRFARMLLVTRDHLEKRDDFDFYSAAMLIPEVAQLGNSIDEIRTLGPEAERKLSLTSHE